MKLGAGAQQRGLEMSALVHGGHPRRPRRQARPTPLRGGRPWLQAAILCQPSPGVLSYRRPPPQRHPSQGQATRKAGPRELTPSATAQASAPPTGRPRRDSGGSTPSPCPSRDCLLGTSMHTGRLSAHSLCVCHPDLCTVTTKPTAESSGLWNLHRPPRSLRPLTPSLPELPRAMLDPANVLLSLCLLVLKYIYAELTQERDESTVNKEQRIDGR